MTATRTLERATRKADKAREHAVRAEAEAERLASGNGDPPPRSAIRRWGIGLVGLLVIGATVAIAITWLTESWWFEPAAPPPATVQVGSVDDLGTAVTVANGQITLSELVRDPQVSQQALITVVGADIYEVSAPIVVAPGGTLDISGSSVRLRSDGETTAAMISGGALNVHNSVIMSWDPETASIDRQLDDGRAYMLTTGVGSTSVTNSVIDGLGYSAPDRNGLTWRTSRGTGLVQNSVIRNGYVGLAVNGTFAEFRATGSRFSFNEKTNVEIHTASQVLIDRNVFGWSDGDGLTVSGNSSFVEISRNEAVANGRSGFAILGAASDVTLSDNEAHRNEGSGVVVGNARGVEVSDNEIWNNRAGVSLAGPNTGTVISENRISSHRGAGIESTSAGTDAMIRDNDLHHNIDGVLIVDGTLDIKANSIQLNNVGINVADPSASLRIVRNDINRNHYAGIHLVTAEGLVIENNDLHENFEAPFQVARSGISTEFRAANDIEAGRKGFEIIDEPALDETSLADLTPAPSYFFPRPENVFDALETSG